MATAAIKFTQGLTSSTPGQALVNGVLTTPVTAANGNDASVETWKWELVYAPPGSALAPGTVFSDGAATSATFVPDVTGGYVVDLTVTDFSGAIAKDRRVFLVPEVSGRSIPPFGADMASLNPGGSTLGWDPYAGQILRLVESAKSITNASGGGLAAVATDNGTKTISCLKLTGSPIVYGLAGGYEGRILYLVASGSVVELDNESGSEGVAANRILTGTGTNLNMPADSATILIYDGAVSRWRVASKSLFHIADDNVSLYAQLPLIAVDQGSAPSTPASGAAIFALLGMLNVKDEAGNVTHLRRVAKVLSVDYQNATNGVTQSNLSFPILANEVFFFMFWANVSCSGVGGSKLQVAAPVGASVEAGYESSSTTVNTPLNQRISAPSTQTGTATHTVGAGTPGLDCIIGRITNGATPGTVSIGAASVTNGQTTKFLAGAALIAVNADAV